jgi:hypothetical protein
VLKKIFWLQLVAAKNRWAPQYLVQVEIFCNTTIFSTYKVAGPLKTG